MEKVCFKTKKGPAALGPYSTATIYGGVIYLSGMIGVNPQTGKAPEGGTLAQAAQAFENIKTVLGEEISMEELGGARVHSEMTGNAHFFATSEEECFVQIRKLISMIPMNNTTKAEKIAPAAPLPQYDITSIVPNDPTVPYDVRDVIKALVDESEFLEVMELFAANIVVGFGRVAGETVGFIANQPLVMAGVLDCDSSDKAARFIRFCDCFNIPIVTLEDLPGYLPGVDQEHAGVIRHGAKMLYAYSEATVPSITVVLRKAYGGGYIAMGSRHLRADFVFAWPLAEIAVMGPEGAANIIFKKDIVGAENPAEPRNVEQLDQENAPPRQGHIIHAVIKAAARRPGRRVDADEPFQIASIREICGHQQRQAHQKSNHRKTVSGQF